MDKVQLVKQCQSGDREAFGILYQTYLVPMREIVAYYVHDPDAPVMVYNLQGIFIGKFKNEAEAISSLKKGIYIINQRKFRIE